MSEPRIWKTCPSVADMLSPDWTPHPYGPGWPGWGSHPRIVNGRFRGSYRIPPENVPRRVVGQAIHEALSERRPEAAVRAVRALGAHRVPLSVWEMMSEGPDSD